MRLRELYESPRTAVMAFGRMNPPTIGHAKLVDALKSQGGDPYLFLSQSQKPKTDPLSFEEKLRYAKFFFPEITIGNPEVKTIIQALQKINELGYDNLIYVAGSDRVASFEELINKYNGQEYNFKSIKVVSAGERDPDADGAEGMSASKMRAAAAAGDLESFKQGVPHQDVADEMYAAVRQGMGIKDKEGVAKGATGWHPSSTVKNPNFNDELSGRRVSPPGKRLKSGKLSADEKGSQERTKALMKYTRKKGGLTGPKGRLPEEQGVAEGCKYGRYYCSTDKKWKCRETPKKSRVSEAATKADADAFIAAVKDFQTKAGLKVDGIVGPQTTAAMKAASAAPAAGGAQQPAATTAQQPAPSAGGAQQPATPGAPATAPAKASAPAQQPAAPAAAPASNSNSTTTDTSTTTSTTTSGGGAKVTKNTVGADGKISTATTNQPPATPAGTQVTNQQSSTTQQGGTTTTSASANISGLDAGQMRASPEWKQMYSAELKKFPGDKQGAAKAADMQYRSELAKGTIKPPAAPAQAAAPAGGNDNF